MRASRRAGAFSHPPPPRSYTPILVFNISNRPEIACVLLLLLLLRAARSFSSAGLRMSGRLPTVFSYALIADDDNSNSILQRLGLRPEGVERILSLKHKVARLLVG